MSFVKPREEDFLPNNPSKTALVQRKTQTGIAEAKPIVINVYHENLSKKSDKVSQTEAAASQSFIIAGKFESPEENQKKLAPRILTHNIIVNSPSKIIDTPPKETKNLMSNKDDRPTEPRKYYVYDGKASKKARAGTELERMKLQAELKATEEIAKLKQTIIEKRLALELATIHNKVEFPSDTQCNSSHVELRALEDLVKKKQDLIEANLNAELQKIECHSRNPRVPSTPPSPLQRLSPPPSPGRCSNPFKTESTSSVLANLRGLTILDKKFTSEKPYTVKPNPINIFDNKYIETRQKPVDWYRKSQDNADRDPVYYMPPFPPGASYNRGQSAWKAAMAKIKKKMRSKSTNPWD